MGRGKARNVRRMSEEVKLRRTTGVATARRERVMADRRRNIAVVGNSARCERTVVATARREEGNVGIVVWWLRYSTIHERRPPPILAEGAHMICGCCSDITH